MEFSGATIQEAQRPATDRLLDLPYVFRLRATTQTAPTRV
jgi:hypothetical protein